MIAIPYNLVIITSHSIQVPNLNLIALLTNMNHFELIWLIWYRNFIHVFSVKRVSNAIKNHIPRHPTNNWQCPEGKCNTNQNYIPVHITYDWIVSNNNLGYQWIKFSDFVISQLTIGFLFCNTIIQQIKQKSGLPCLQEATCDCKYWFNISYLWLGRSFHCLNDWTLNVKSNGNSLRTLNNYKGEATFHFLITTEAVNITGFFNTTCGSRGKHWEQGFVWTLNREF